MPGAATVVRCEEVRSEEPCAGRGPGVPRCAKCKAFLPWVVEANDENFTLRRRRIHGPVLVDLGTLVRSVPAGEPALEELPPLRRSGEAGEVNVDASPASRNASAPGHTTMLVIEGQRDPRPPDGSRPRARAPDWLAKSPAPAAELSLLRLEDLRQQSSGWSALCPLSHE